MIHFNISFPEFIDIMTIPSIKQKYTHVLALVTVPIRQLFISKENLKPKMKFLKINMREKSR